METRKRDNWTNLDPLGKNTRARLGLTNRRRTALDCRAIAGLTQNEPNTSASFQSLLPTSLECGSSNGKRDIKDRKASTSVTLNLLFEWPKGLLKMKLHQFVFAF